MGLGTLIAVVVIALVILSIGLPAFLGAVYDGGQIAWDRWIRDLVSGSSGGRMVLHHTAVSVS
jgi:hypothetical protein